MELDLVSRDEIEEVVGEVGSSLGVGEIDEMAVPSYLHKNPLIIWLLKRRHKMLLSLVENRGRVLDFGCGVGVLLPSLKTHFNEVVAIDLYPEMAKMLVKKRGTEVKFEKRIEKIESKSVDTIVASEVLEHVDELGELIDELKRVLKKGGELVISGPTENGWYKLGRYLAGFGRKGDYHVRNVDEIIGKITEHGLGQVVVKRIPFGFLTLYKVARFEKK